MASQIVSPADSILGIGGSVHADGTVLISGNPEISLESQTPSGPKKSTGGENTKQRVCYFYDGEIGNFYYGTGHPMKPHRIRMTHNLLLHYGMYKKLAVYRPWRATPLQMTKFHSDDYIEFLQNISLENSTEYSRQLQAFNVGEDCPIFDGLFQLCQIAAGGSVGGAMKLNQGAYDISINWAGGLHHAKKSEASGFCYVNDIVLGILELLKFHARVLYIDIDIHHGDGVEEAFYTTSRVMTLSFHKYGDYFPGTGDLSDIGAGEGKYFAVNVPLRDGMTDESYEGMFKPIVQTIMDTYRPGAIVMQCGADSLTGDRLGCFNLSLNGHGKCVQFVKNFHVPLLLVGGGGYTIRNVARCWCNETAVALDMQLPEDLPYNDYLEYFAPDYKLPITPNPVMENMNNKQYLDDILARILQNLKHAQGAIPIPPSAQFREENPQRFYDIDDEDEATETPDAPSEDYRVTPSKRQAAEAPESEPPAKRAKVSIMASDSLKDQPELQSDIPKQNEASSVPVSPPQKQRKALIL